MKMKFGILNLVLMFVLLMTIDVGYAQQYPASQQVKYPMNLYTQADTKGVLVIGSGAPSFTPKAKQSRVYVDSVAGNIYCRKNGSWVLFAGKGTSFVDANLRATEARTHSFSGNDLKLDSIARFTINALAYANITSPANTLTGAINKVVGGNFQVDIPSRVGVPEGSFLYKTAGDTLVYSAFGFKPGLPGNNTSLYFETSDNRWRPTTKFSALIPATEYDNDAAAALAGIGVNEYYVLSATNTYTLPQGVVKKRIL